MNRNNEPRLNRALSPISDWRLRVALSASKMGLWDWDLQTGAVTWSPETFALVGFQEFDGRFDSFAKLVHPEDLPRVIAQVDRALSERSEYSDEFRIFRPDGQERWLCNLGRPTLDDNGEPVRLSGTVQDVTERKQSEQVLKGYAQRLIVLEEELRKKVSIELHDDIAQELSALGFNLGHLSKNLPKRTSEKVLSALEDSRRLTKQINRSVRNLMVELHPLPLEEFGLVGAISDYANRFAKRTGLALSLELSPVLPRLAAQAELALFRITQEALTNVLKHAAATSVTISLGRTGALLQLSIKDDGHGFHAERASRQPAGTGWGITIMRQRAALAGGSLRVQTEPGAGTTIMVEMQAP
ncbi:hypothetical protein GMLC_19180 [Geomonas limicola]|uniref:Oxygen sensor histidine kinase NreB n=1 Tax=Geomonas limicola TaxID=2740186 RepID=A0A6V8NAT5_9BACT|nr:PAS domain-containing protein [Geomonas limicola]GFO68339.1 hypothetical protein GMLC_19180 [Geomonas limicola]